jgi:hypothetical protein
MLALPACVCPCPSLVLQCRVWDAREMDVIMSADLGYVLSGIAFSQEPIGFMVRRDGGGQGRVRPADVHW